VQDPVKVIFMTHRRRWNQAIAVGSLAFILGWVLPAGAQTSSLSASVIQAARDTYVLIRAARHGMELAKSAQTFPDPVLDLTLKRVTQAWDLSRIPVDEYSWGIPRVDYRGQSIPALSQSMRLLDQALVMMP